MYNTHIRIAIALALLSLFYCAKTLVFYWNIGSIIHITCRKTLFHEAHYQYIKDSFIFLCLRLQPTLAYAIELLYIVLCANLCVAQYTTHIYTRYMYRYSQRYNHDARS